MGDDELRRTVLLMAMAGESPVRIADQLGLSEPTVQRLLADAHRPPRQSASNWKKAALPSSVTTRDGLVVELLAVPAADAVRQWEELHASAPASGQWPVIAGDPSGIPGDDPLQRFLDGTAERWAPPASEIVAAAAGVDCAALFDQQWADSFPEEDPDEEPEAFEVYDERPPRVPPPPIPGRLVPEAGEAVIALVPAATSEDVLAVLGWGGWNACPPPHEHVALLRHWRERYGAVLRAVSTDTLELSVAARRARSKLRCRWPAGSTAMRPTSCTKASTSRSARSRPHSSAASAGTSGGTDPLGSRVSGAADVPPGKGGGSMRVPVRRLGSVVAIAAAAVVMAAAPSSGAVVPPIIAVPSGHSLHLIAHATGYQVYTCQAQNGGFTWVLAYPWAGLFDPNNNAIGFHYGGPTWQGSDGSKVVAARVASSPSPGTIPWLLLQAVSNSGPVGGQFTTTSYIQRINTTGGLAPATGCDQAHAGELRAIPYTADYYFYRPAGNSG